MRFRATKVAESLPLSGKSRLRILFFPHIFIQETRAPPTKERFHSVSSQTNSVPEESENLILFSHPSGVIYCLPFPSVEKKRI